MNYLIFVMSCVLFVCTIDKNVESEKTLDNDKTITQMSL